MYKVFADLNCPFCYVQHLRMRSLDLVSASDVQWCYVEHAPSIDTDNNTDDQLNQLNQEFHIIRQRGADAKMAFPGFCVNTRLAILTLITIELEQPVKAKQFRVALYDAYWLHALDISKPQVIEEIMVEIGLTPKSYSDKALAVLEANHQDWHHCDLDRRIPSVMAKDRRTLLGLQHQDNIEAFFRGESIELVDQSDVCIAHEHRSVLFVGGLDRASQFNQHSEAFDVTAWVNLAQGDLGAQHNFACIVVNVDSDDVVTIETVKALRQKDWLQQATPIVVVSPEHCEEGEARAFQYGASDYISSDISPRCLEARLSHHVKTFQSCQLLAKYASVDSLTGIYNRRIMLKKLEEEWRRGCRNSQEIAVIVIDIDHFKAFNDIYGHCAGDDCIRSVATIINRQLLRPGDFAARMGGEEFLVVAPSTDLQGAMSIAERIQCAVEHACMVHKGNPSNDILTLSMGVSTTTPHPDATPKQLVSQADSALYEAKENGRNCVISKRLKAPVIRPLKTH